ncbi:TPA: DNA recombination protein RmuC [Legionella pneumophila subsp. pneumophila]|uniref:DNA recombination protein RmuC n=1 Tax=Legionella pneumophila TaxID=446 RepID=UPI00058D7885|nr:DNA recombination protein RmuC [Legionella pneumophila]MDC8028660.1 DNA recombination protein RmuC [Legionella pneumophila subsp. pneumophila]MDW8869555.1 DNA recombination protein RmuC [Legionella pneumophila]MDW8915565.1 DNA recombination protein RmuC [Legionella pneumophila]MDW8923897.1 DNA recombination protein RmuC [Legionella pneumophila]MDW8930246.1 DNA recombination protein RmuC [Legionella pneumophila]
MQDIQWTTELISIAIIIGITLTTIGFLLAMVLQGRKLTYITTQLEHSQKTIEQTNNTNTEIQAQLKNTQSTLHQKELLESKLQEQFSNAKANEQRLASELAMLKDELTDLGSKLEHMHQQMHISEKKYEAAQAENRALQKQASDLDQRLTQTNQALEKERNLVSELKDYLSQEGKKTKSLEVSEKEAREQLNEIKLKMSEQITDYRQLQERNQSLSNEYTELKTTLERKEEHFKEQMQQLNEAKLALTREFENLANKIFEEKGKAFTHNSQVSIDNILKPFREQIEGFQKRINEVHDASIQGNTSLSFEIKKVLDIGLQMSKEANNLTSALKGNSQQRGAWGEAQLRRTLEMSGLIENTHYEVQSSFKDSEGKQKQTDYLIKLPDGKHIIIDSKVTLNAYDRAVAAESPEEYQLAMNEHVKAVRKHIDDLTSKDYTNLIGMRSPSFVLMFMPMEPAYIEALKSNKDLFEYGYNKGIVLVSHTTLIPILRTVSNLWMIERSNAEAREISEKAGEIYNQVCIVAERLSKLGSTLSIASNHYNNTVKALVGQQGLYGKVDRFSQLSAKVSKSMPQLEPSHMDFETERLSLIIEPIDEEQVQSASLKIENKSDTTSVTAPTDDPNIGRKSKTEN